MSLTLASIALSLIAQAGPAAAPASPQTPVSVTVSIGRGKTYDDESYAGAGTSLAGGVEWRFRPKWSVGAEVERLGHKRDTSGLDWSGRTVFASANIVYRFAARGVTPYVGGGYGGAFHKGETSSQFTGTTLTTPHSSTSPMEYGTLGVEIPVGDRFAVSPEFRLTICQAPNDSAPWAAFRFGVKGAWRF